MRCLFFPMIVVTFLSSFTTCEAQHGRYLGDALARVSPEDRKMMERARRQVLEQNRVGKGIPWANPKTGNSGEVALLRTFKRNGTYCSEVEYVTRANQTRRFSLNFCQTAEGWKIAS